MKTIMVVLVIISSVMIVSFSKQAGNDRIQYREDNYTIKEQNFDNKYVVKPEAFSYKGHEFFKLPYDFNALEPVIDALTVEIHYSKHQKGYFIRYVDMVNGTELENKSLEEIFKSINKHPVALKKNAGQYYNHILYWNVLSPDGGGVPQGSLNKAIVRDFGSFEQFKERFNNAAGSVFGSGWAWLCVDKQGKLFISITSNDENPLMDAENRGTPILALDVWEHAYYLKYQNRRPEYVEAFFNIINWREVERRYYEAVGK